MIVLGLGVLLLAAVLVVQSRITERHRLALAGAFGFALVLTIAGWGMAPRVELYSAPWWGWYAVFALTLSAFICLSIYAFRGTWRAKIRAPLELAVVLWSAGHLLANGDTASVILFGGLGAASAVRLCLVSPPSTPSVVRTGHDALSLLIGTALFGAMAQLHQVYAGVPVFVIPAVAP